MRTEDGNIICQCLEGKPASFGLLVDKYKASILAIAYAELHNMQDAEEVAQDAFIQAYKKLNTLRRWDSFLSWICAITYNLCKRRLSSQSKRPDSEFIEDQEPEIIERPSIDSYNMSKSNESLDDTIDIINKALDSLPKIYSQILTLHYLGGMSVREMAQVLSISPDNIKQRLSRARAKLREEVLTMMNTTFEQQKLQASFTFNIVEMIKQIKIHTIPRIPWISWGFSVGIGLIFTVINFFPNIVFNVPIGTHTGSPLPCEFRVLKVGEIPVDVVKTAEMTFISNLSGKGKDGEPKISDMQNTFFMSPQAEGGEWVKKADMPNARIQMGAVAVNGKIYTFGGINANSAFFSTVEEYDPVNDKWTKKTDMPTPRGNLCAAAVNGKIYAISGMRVDGKVVPTVEEYDPVNDLWAKKSDMPDAREAACIAVANNKIYIIGGDFTDNPNDFGPALPKVLEYDPATDKWTKKSDIRTPRTGASAVVVDNKIYVIDGFNGGQFFSVVEIYDPINDTWTKGVDTMTARSFPISCAVDGKIYVIGGYNGTVAISDVQEYDTGFRPSQNVELKGKLSTTWGKKKQN